jgi:hypothetical protein
MNVKEPLDGATTVPVQRTEKPVAGTEAKAGLDDPPGAAPFQANRTRVSLRVNEGAPLNVELLK